MKKLLLVFQNYDYKMSIKSLKDNSLALVILCIFYVYLFFSKAQKKTSFRGLDTINNLPMNVIFYLVGEFSLVD